MSEFVLVVDIEVKPGSEAAFQELISVNAKASAGTEDGCKQFDVLQSRETPTKFALYEVYADEAAFASHREQLHTKTFFAGAKDLVVSQNARQFTRTANNPG